MNTSQLLIATFALCFLASSAFGQEQNAEGKVHALLVGVTKYPGRTEMEQLTGPENDVQAMAKTLQLRFNVPDDRITRLTQVQPDHLKPSYANIKREFLAMVGKVNAGDQVFVLLSGHGSQVPNDDDDAASDYEVDGLDEVFLPNDLVEFNEVTEKLEGPVIRDDEIETWLTRIQDKGATVLFVSDSCHSESQTRGTGGPLDDQIRTREVKLIPKEYLDRFIPSKSRGTADAGSELIPLNGKPKGSLIAFFAARSSETTPDGFRDPDSWDKVDMGMLTYSVSEILRSIGPRITYRELGQQINKRYALWKAKGVGANVPTPIMHAADLDRVVFGNAMLPGRSRLTFARKGTLLEVSGGSIDGLTRDSILQLFPEAGSTGESDPIGWAVIQSVKLRKSIARVVSFSPESGQIGETIAGHGLVAGRCDLFIRDYGDIKLTVAIGDSIEDSRLKARIVSLAGKLASPFEIVPESQAEFILDVRDGLLMLSRADKDTMTTATFDLGAAKGRMVENQISGAIERIWKAKSLTDIAFQMQPHNRSSNNSDSLGISAGVVVEVGGLNEAGVWQGEPWDFSLGEPLPVGKEVRFYLENYSQVPVRMTLLYIGDDFQVTPIWPTNGAEGALPAAKNGTPARSPFPIQQKIGTSSRGPEAILAIATRNDETMNSQSDYTYLRQPGLPAVWMSGYSGTTNLASQRNRSKSVRGGNLSPLDRLLDSSAFRTSKSRASLTKSENVTDYAVSATVWTARSEAKMVQTKPDLSLRDTYGPIANGPWQPDVVKQNPRGVGKSVYPKVAPAVVVVRTANGHGTGFLISPTGYVLTNHHVVEDAIVDPTTGFRTVDINLGTLDNGWMKLIDTPVEADIYKWSEEKDLALLKLRSTPESLTTLPSISLADSVPAPGSDCIAIGHPGRGALWTLRSGSVAGKAQWPGERIDAILQRLQIAEPARLQFEEQLQAAVQMTVLYSECGLNPGDSGGPLLNSDGELIAVSFAIPTIDMESGVSYDKFSYHVHLDEVKKFIRDMPTEPLSFGGKSGKKSKNGSVQSDKDLAGFGDFIRSWQSANLNDLSSNGQPETVVFSDADDGSLGMLVDLDEDSSPEVYEKAESLTEIISARESEFACVLADTSVFFYDTDNDGAFDLKLEDVDSDGIADSYQSLKSGSWQESGKRERVRVLDINHFVESVRLSVAQAFQQVTYSLKKMTL